MRTFNHLYIIGNGFDLYHGLMTGYNHFRRYVQKNDVELYELIEKYYEYKEDDFWYNFEENLATLDDFALREYARNFLEDYGFDKWRDAYHHDYQLIHRAHHKRRLLHPQMNLLLSHGQ